MNKCAKFHKDSPSDKKVKFNLANFRRRPIVCTTLYRNGLPIAIGSTALYRLKAKIPIYQLADQPNPHLCGDLALSIKRSASDQIGDLV